MSINTNYSLYITLFKYIPLELIATALRNLSILLLVVLLVTLVVLLVTLVDVVAFILSFYSFYEMQKRLPSITTSLFGGELVSSAYKYFG